MASRIYSIDASSLLKLKQDFPRKVFPAVWEKIEQLVREGRLIAPEEVHHELENDDLLEHWAKQRKAMFRKMTQEIWEVAEEVARRFPALAKPGKFGPAADPFVVAVAKVENQNRSRTLYDDPPECIVVTEEGGGPHQIPAACSAFGVQYVNLVGLFQLEEWEFR